MSLRLIITEETFPLRQRVLRPFHGPEACHFPGDDLETTFHVGSFDHADLLAIASMFLKPHPRCPGDRTYRLRGMAVVPERQRSGLGKEILGFAEAEAIRRGGCQLWCNARAGALGFYEHLGYTSLGELFEIDGIGPHYVCVKSLGQ